MRVPHRDEKDREKGPEYGAARQDDERKAKKEVHGCGDMQVAGVTKEDAQDRTEGCQAHHANEGTDVHTSNGAHTHAHTHAKQTLIEIGIAKDGLLRITAACLVVTQAGYIMDVLNLWQDDPEELLLDLGFGAEEPDITVRIPSRFINQPSQARGINIQVFLDAQQSRVDIENPDVRTRFRQIEVLQQVSTAFSSLVGGTATPEKKPVEQPITEETRERRRRVGMLFRKAFKKSSSQRAKSRDQPSLSPLLEDQSLDSEPPGESPLDKRIPPKRVGLSPLIEEQGPVSEAAETTKNKPVPQDNNLKGGKEPKNGTTNGTTTQRNPGVPAESFELEEIQSFDEGSIGGSYAGNPDHSGHDRACLSRVSSCLVRTTSCQSDSSGFLEEPFVPPIPTPGPELMKVLSAMSGDSTDGQQKSIDQQDSELPYQDSPQILPSDTGTKRPADTTPVMRHGDTAKNHVQDMYMNSVRESRTLQKDLPGPPTSYVKTSTTAQKDLPGLRGYLGENSTLQKGVSGLSNSDDYVGAGTMLQKNLPGLPGQGGESTSQGLRDYVRGSTIVQNGSQGQRGSYVVGNATLQDNSQGLRDYLRTSTILQKDLPGLSDTAGGSTTLEKDLPGLRGYMGETRTLKDTPNPPYNVVLGNNTQMESTSPEAERRENKASPYTEATVTYYSGRSVSVQMRSNSQSSMRGSMSHSSSFGNSPVSPGELRRDSFLRMEQLDNNFDTGLDPTRKAVMPAKSDYRSQDSFSGVQRFGQRLTSLETGRSYEEDTRWESALWSGARSGARCCDSCHHKQQSFGSRQSSTASSFSYSMEELVGMMRCMWKFRKMLSEIEDRLQEEHTSVSGALSDEQRTDVQDILELRTAVKKEADLLEQQLNDLLQAYDDNLKMKMNRLLDEQSYLCTELRFNRHSANHPDHTSKKSIGIQCNLLPVMETPESRVFPQLSNDSQFIYNRDWNPDSKADKLNFVGHIKSFKDRSLS
ncbi:protein ITPRID1 [Trichomycterus rosablanca]|uniref:protein ITPRID1 n=1 Tax=Trichomycterus rosablanca TaxID=2290929 RepID=UPI002F35E232